MKVSPAQADRFLDNPDPTIRALLVFGPDSGLVAERALRAVRAVVEDPADPFRVVEITKARLKEEPSAVADEAAALSFSPGRRVVRLKGGGEDLRPALESFLDNSVGDALVVVEAGDLPARSGLRRLFEQSKAAAAVACYRDDGRSLVRTIDETLGSYHLSASRDALAFLEQNLGGDRLVTRRELEKLALYLGDERTTVELGDAMACVGDAAELGLEDLAMAVADGDFAEVERASIRCLAEGANPVQVLRAIQRHLQRLYLVAACLAAGEGLETAMRRLRPPVFWRVKNRFAKQARSWQLPTLARAMTEILEAEKACKLTGTPAETVALGAVLEIARRVPGNQARKARL